MDVSEHLGRLGFQNYDPQSGIVINPNPLERRTSDDPGDPIGGYKLLWGSMVYQGQMT
jgi:hypothetical protein